MTENFWQGLAFSILAFGAWGLGNNLAAVSYLSLASDLSNEQERSRVISIMWFMMLIGIIGTAILAGNALEPYSDAQLITVFNRVAVVSIALAILGLVGLEPRVRSTTQPYQSERVSQQAALATVFGNPHARVFFLYLLLLLSAILGQDVLMEPFGAQTFGMNVKQTTQITALWGGTTMVALLLQGLLLNKWLSNKQGAMLGNSIAAIGLVLIATSGMLQMQPLFIPGIAALGFGTGIATTTNLALMLSMTTPEKTGLFIGAWGVADALARGMGNLMGGVVRDVITHATSSIIGGYTSVFLLEAGMLLVSLLLLRSIDTRGFQSEQQSLSEVIALAGDA
jgi:BCD family chlorophyll transporter-like MFS transporter